MKWRDIEKKVAGFFYRKGCSFEDTCELVQETGFRAFKNCHSMHTDFHAWVFGIARNVFFEYLSSRKKDSFIIDDRNTESILCSSNPERTAILRTLIHQCLHELPVIERKCLVLHDYSGKNYNEIAQILGISRSNAHYHVERARNTVRLRFPELVNDPEFEGTLVNEHRYFQGLPVFN